LQLLQRHESLRTVICTNHDGVPVQSVMSAKSSALMFEIRDHGMEQAAGIHSQPDDSFGKFILETGPLMQVRLTKLEEQSYCLEIACHHIIADGWSMGVIAEELSALYAGKTLPLPRLQYRDFVKRQQTWLQSDDGIEAKRYWMQTFSGEIPLLDMPADYPRPKDRQYIGGVVQHRFAPETSRKIQASCQTLGVSLFSLLLSAVSALVHRYTGMTDFTLGTPMSGRLDPDSEDQVGLFMNTLALRIRMDASDGFSQLTDKVSQTLGEALQYQVYPFDKLVEDLKIERNLNRTPLFDVLVSLQNQKSSAFSLAGLSTLVDDDTHSGRVKHDLSFYFGIHHDDLGLSVEFDGELYANDRVKRLCEHLEALIQDALADPVKPVVTLNLLTDTEFAALNRSMLDQTLLPSSKATRFIDLLASNMPRFKQRIALQCGLSTMSYAELETKANQICQKLTREFGVGEGHAVAVSIPRSVDLVCAILGVWKAGAIYVPVDPGLPQDRKDYIVSNSGCSVVMTQADSFVLTGLAPIEMPDQTAYVLYTSGSTGKPKGVMVSHGNLTAFCENLTNRFGMHPEDRIYALTTISFDISILELLCPLVFGMTIVIATEDVASDPLLAAKEIVEQSISVLQVTPTRLTLLMDASSQLLSKVRILLVGGEALNDALARRIAAVSEAHPDLVAMNVYGPTETTIWSSADRIQAEQVTVGMPLDGEQVLIVNSALKPQPVGIPGEILIAGSGVALGYVGLESLTREKFVFHPLDKRMRAYRTGDVGWIQSDGRIVFGGRRDSQVKVRGYRVELGEIESVLAAHPEVRRSAVLVHSKESGNELIAYLVAPQSSLESIRHHLSRLLPSYMHPLIVFLEDMPLLPSGKMDRNALLALNVQQSSATAATELFLSDDPLTVAIAAIWQDVLKCGPIGMDINFFDMGGHSLSAARVAGQVRSELGLETGIRDIFSAPTVRSYRELLGNRHQRQLVASLPAPVQEWYPLSHSQRRIWIQSNFDGGCEAYFISGALALSGKFDRKAFSLALEALVQRHESLRTVFSLQQGEPMQKILDGIQDYFSYRDISRRKNKDARVVEGLIESLAHEPVDLEHGPLFRMVCFKLAPESHVLWFGVHHIIADGWSLGLILRDLEDMYLAIIRRQTLDKPALSLQYKDYAYWEREQAESEGWLRSKAYWIQALSTVQMGVELPFIKQRPQVRGANAGVVMFSLSEEETSHVMEICAKHGVTLFMGVLASWFAVLHRMTSQRKLVIGTVYNNRDDLAYQDVVGCFVNPVPVPVMLDPEMRFDDLLSLVRSTTLDCLQHASYPFDQVVKDLGLQVTPNRTPIFDIGFSWNALSHMQHQSLGEADIRPYGNQTIHPKYDLLIIAGLDGGALTGVIEFDSDLYDHSQIEDLAEKATGVMRAVTANVATALADLPLGDSVSQQDQASTPVSIHLNF